MTLTRRRPELSTAALEDLRSLADYVGKFDEAAAQRLVDDLVDKLHHIAEIGVTGSKRSFLPADARLSLSEMVFLFHGERHQSQRAASVEQRSGCDSHCIRLR